MLVPDPVPTRAPAAPAHQRQAPVAELAEGRLRGQPYLALRHVWCDYLDGVLILRGCLPSYHLKQLAQEAVARLEAVAHVDNQIEVVAPAFRRRWD